MTSDESRSEEVAPARPTIAIYQNPDHVAGILQQLYAAPLVINESREQGVGSSSSNKAETKAQGGLKAGVDLPFVGELGIDTTGDHARAREAGLTNNSKTVQNFTYSQAYYLFLVRETLRRHGMLQTISTAADAADLKSGDFVEFQATFRASAMHALLDILTPALIAAITEYQVKSDGAKRMPDFANIDELKIYSEKLFQRAAMQADIARVTAEAVRVDFRTQKTREFYGRVKDVTAITICDNAHFVVEDEDRILDGSFTVLGKATSELERDVPVLARNKLLDRISPEVVDSLFGRLKSDLAQQADSLTLGNGEEFSMEAVFDLALPS